MVTGTLFRLSPVLALVNVSQPNLPPTHLRAPTNSHTRAQPQAALSLYMDIVNLFLNILRLVAATQDSSNN